MLTLHTVLMIFTSRLVYIYSIVSSPKAVGVRTKRFRTKVREPSKCYASENQTPVSFLPAQKCLISLTKMSQNVAYELHTILFSCIIERGICTYIHICPHVCTYVHAREATFNANSAQFSLNLS
jgi:hypothetical protein